MPIGIFTNTLFGFLSTISYKQWFLYLCIPHGALYQTTGDGLNMVCLNSFSHITNYTHVAFMTIFITDISYINLELLLCHLGSFFDKPGLNKFEFALYTCRSGFLNSYYTNCARVFQRQVPLFQYACLCTPSNVQFQTKNRDFNKFYCNYSRMQHTFCSTVYKTVNH